MTADELKAAFAALSQMEPVEPEHSWKFWAWDLRQNVKNNDPEDFLNWPGLVTTMFVGNAPYIEFEYNEIPFDYLVKLDDPGIGNPPLYEILENLKPSGNLIHQAYHLWQWEQRHDKLVAELDTIIEIGGGYGAMALIVYRLGFRGRYIILDLPEFSLLQQYYLSNVGIEDVEFRTRIDKQIDCDLLIGLFSLSEMPLHTRETIIDLCPSRSYLAAYGANWGGFDNMGWAMELMKRKKGFTWHNWNVAHLPNCWYLVGNKRE